ncbi:MAG: hydroxysqualene dehydroxylase HpnE [Sciscionella sp.]
MVVVGGGLAGLVAGCALAERGMRVTLLEARARLGGATFSFQRGGLTVDNGQHVLLRCYRQYLGWLEKIGAGGDISMQRRFTIPVRRVGGPEGRLTRLPGLPAPLHLGPALARYSQLSTVDRARLLPAVAALRFVDPTDPASDRMSFGDWLRRHRQNRATIEAVWDLVTVAALNTDTANASLALAAKVFRTALLERADAADIGVPSVDLSRLHAEPAAAYLAERGADIRLRCVVRGVRRDGGEWEVAIDGARLRADAVVLAVPPAAAQRLCPADVVPPGAAFSDLGTAPIVNVHMVYPERVTSLPFFAAIDSPAQWVFDKTAVSGVDGGCQYLAVSVSAAQDWIDEPTARLRDVFTAEMARLLPRAGGLALGEFFVTRERAATFRQAPGSGRLRPCARTAIAGLALAGAWTATGWPDTMEGAVRSGSEAARVISEELACMRVKGSA